VVGIEYRDKCGIFNRRAIAKQRDSYVITKGAKNEKINDLAGNTDHDNYVEFCLSSICRHR
jgi:hypothetical protein